jgi:hypothetical protein
MMTVYGQATMNKHEFAIWVDNHGHEISLELRKPYDVVADPDAERHGQIRVIDTSGEDYLYPATEFNRVSLPESVIERVATAQA